MFLLLTAGVILQILHARLRAVIGKMILGILLAGVNNIAAGV
jgi:hypothetical protein